ncbi:alpha-amylase family glycosyl hydrolase [Roseomonas populi]|uniref:Alpha-amylase family glycosyl hydrolase n=1 Tax=Roseomonas populi TaxID=3121582 RepID=A0ABT1X7A9_9PROT|nr:alpha-amylase family glycosyl hydrolase [Roseomonas pecuniae]MCR0983589.1 alpha-amylase family glycosyl hydrolase [Roseomonas pecuniae]
MSDTLWWQHGIVYQIYPRSFQDSNGDGIGDLEGIRRRLDHLVWLGVDAVWISPIFPSPMADFGYDIADYCGVDPIFGTIDDFDRLLAEAHARGLKVILDFVPNHTSDRHPWFLESRASRDSAYRDWYIWRDPGPGGGPPNNWLANFGGSGWEYDEATGQYYFHSFLKEQPDLNWRNPAVRQAMYDALRFWLDRGVDGFRVDVIWLLVKDEEFRDNPPNPAWEPHHASINQLLQVYSADRPETLEVVEEMRAVLDEYDGRVLIGEIYLPLERLMAYYGRDMKGAHLPFNFQLIFAAWNAVQIARIVAEYEAALPPGGWPNWVLGNHDQKRIASRVGPGGARLAAMLLLTLRGTPTLYYGDELGLENVTIPPDRAQDPWERNEPGLGLGRDPARTPMPWNAGRNGGFTTGEPWLPLNDDHAARNVAALSADPASLLHLYRRLIALRRDHAALSTGDYVGVEVEGEVLAFERRQAGARLLVALNFGQAPARLPLPQDAPGAELLLSTHPGREAAPVPAELQLGPEEGVVLALRPG